MSDSRLQRRIPFGELIAFAALIVSAFGVWIAWKSSNRDEPTRVVEQRPAIPLTLRGRVEDGGRSLEIAPIESGHALQSLIIIAGGSKIELGGDGKLDAEAIEKLLAKARRRTKPSIAWRCGSWRNMLKPARTRPPPAPTRSAIAGKEAACLAVARFGWSA